MLTTLAMAVALAAAPRAEVRHAPSGFTIRTLRGSLPDGATYLMEVPSGWNGTLVLYSHGYNANGNPNPAYDVGDPVSGNYLLSNGYALAGSSYASTGWAVAQALPDQIDVLDTFAKLVKRPRRTIAWGHSMGGLITAGLIQRYPSRFDGALPMCGVLAGGVGLWNLALDRAFAIDTLLAGGALQIVDITSPHDNYVKAASALQAAQNTTQGRARIALAAAISDTPGWYDASSPSPAPTDYASLEYNQFRWLANVDAGFDFFLRAELEGRAGGNPSFNSGVDYRVQLAKSVDRGEVEALYTAAGLDLAADLRALDDAPRVKALPSALAYLSGNIIFDGRLTVPVLTMQTQGDGLVVDENDSAYSAVVARRDDGARLRRTFVHRAGHCSFTSGEDVAAFLALVRRLDSGTWTGLRASDLDDVARGLGSNFNPFPASFVDFAPAPFLRPYDAPPR